MNNKRNLGLSILFSGILFLLVGVTYSFFNYTRTGIANNIRVGRLSFNITQDNTITLNNLFPIKSSDLDTDTDNHDTITINITGDTTYSEGIEYLVTFVDVNNIINNKRIPITYEVESTNIGTQNSDYYNVRGSDTPLYYIEETGEVRENKYILVGYIPSGQIGIDGSFDITAYIDAERIAITDTYDPNQREYIVNPNITQTEINTCVSYVTSIFGPEEVGVTVQNGETYAGFCAGTGTNGGNTLQDILDRNLMGSQDLEYMVEHNIILHKNYTDDTTIEWVNGRVVFTTEEWNSLSGNNPLSFKVKVEANEGIWVDREATPGSCFQTELYTKEINYNSERTTSDVNACIGYLTYEFGEESVGNTVDVGETYEAFCEGTGTKFGETIVEYAAYNNSFSKDLKNLNILNIIFGLDITEYDTSCGTKVTIPKKLSYTETEYTSTYNESRTTTEINDCITFLTNLDGPEEEGVTVDVDETYEGFCDGTGTLWGFNIRHADELLSIDELTGLDNINIISLVITENTNNYTVGKISGLAYEFGAFSGANLTNLIIQDNIDEIGSYSLYGNKLQNITIPSSVKKIGSYAFQNNELTSVIIPNGVTWIGTESFANNNLSSVSLPNSLTFIGEYAFRGYGTTPLDTLYYDVNTEINNSSSVANYFGLRTKSLIIGNNVTNIYIKQFEDTKIENITFGSNIEEIGHQAFRKNLMTNVEIPASIISIGQNAFDQCTNLTSIKINKSCTNIKSMSNYPWVSSGYQTGLIVYGSNNEICDSW